MQLTCEEFDELFGAIGEYGRHEYRAGLASGPAARSALRDAHDALTALHGRLAPAVTQTVAVSQAPAVAEAPRPARADGGVDHRAAAREHVLVNQPMSGDPGELARECLTWIGSYRTDLDAEVYRSCVLGVLDAYRELLSAPPSPWATAATAATSSPAIPYQR